MNEITRRYTWHLLTMKGVFTVDVPIYKIYRRIVLLHLKSVK